MKVWGYRAFENEAAVKWLTKVVTGRGSYPLGSRGPVEEVFEMFGEWGRGSPEEYASAEAVAACELLAALHGRPGPDAPSVMHDAAAAVKGKVSVALLARGAKYLERIAERSELVSRWQPTPHFAAWQAYLAELGERLR